MKLILIQPPIQDFYETKIRLQPIGLAYLKAAIKKFLPNITVKILDFHQNFGRKTISLPSELNYLREFYPCPDISPFCTFYHYYHFGADFKQAAEKIAQENPDIIGISILFSSYFREALTLAKEIKKVCPVPIIAGGSHVSAEPLSILQSPWIDFVIYGEGEKPLIELLKQFQGNKQFEQVPNLGFKKNNKFFLNPKKPNYPFEELPLPDLSDFSLNNYQFQKKPLYFITTSRGCPHQCTFCSAKSTFPIYKKRSVENILEEIKIRYKQGYRVFDFEDDNLTFFIDDMKKLCKLIIKEFPQNKIRFLAMNGISYLHLDNDLLLLMKKIGFTDLNLSLVSSDESVLRSCHRPHTVKKFTQIIQTGFKLKFNMTAYQILGLPHESISSMLTTLIFLARQPVLIGPSIFYLAPGSKIACQFSPLKEKDFFLARSSAMAIETKHFSREDIYSLFICTRIINFLKQFDINTSLNNLLLSHKTSNKRINIGLEILRKLIYEKKLHAYTGKQFVELKKFKWEIFYKLFSRLKFITSKTGQKIFI
ncbi:B12 binding domain-containing protein [Desulfonauticus submarinus]|uniref:B12 binding domain-containing protein n=1 Tax=Desulfonauticus submarinus TaxID=206665 RepID=A0A1G9ZP89_9BACT|nr:radical SAM protein [Desulfonauticus submarinus]SDN23138.1 B12 binding domain-containing protein [Desulfonauticus submarinus]